MTLERVSYGLQHVVSIFTLVKIKKSKSMRGGKCQFGVLAPPSNLQSAGGRGWQWVRDENKFAGATPLCVCEKGESLLVKGLRQ